MSRVLNNEQNKVSLYSNVLMILTSIHHAYGAIVYHTEWRFHVLLLSVPVIIVTLFLNRLLNKRGYTYNNYLFWIYWIIILLASIVAIGVFEGVYNHILKNIIYFGGFPKNWMDKLFPSGVYEMPDNLFFEITGMLQGVMAILLIKYFIQLTRNVLNSKNLEQSFK